MAASILNNVIGPVMPGSSSSHTAGPYHIAKLFRGFAGALPKRAVFTFAPGSSIAECYRDQGSDLALVMGILGLPLTDVRFKDALSIFPSFGIEIEFVIENFAGARHPNSIKIEADMGGGGSLRAVADSTGGGAFILHSLNGCSVDIAGDAYYLFAESEQPLPAGLPGKFGKVTKQGNCLLLASPYEIPCELVDRLRAAPGIIAVRSAEPVFYPIRGEALYKDGCGMIEYARAHSLSLGEAALEYESALLDMPKEELNQEMERRLAVMERAVELGLSNDSPPMSLLSPTAGEIMAAEAAGRLALGGIHTLAAARAMAAMQVNSGQGIVCAAPTGGSAGVLPGVVVTMLKDLNIARADVVRAMWAAGAAGWVLGEHGTFAAEVCGCQVEIGAAGAMGAAAVVEMAGGSAAQCCDAAAVMFQNAMGLVCDLVQATVEIPCHTRNASFASQAFICADLVLGGYRNPVGIDGTVEAVCATGRMMPCELRCTSLGGMAVTEEALAMKKRR